jgi:hypothetical protein
MAGLRLDTREGAFEERKSGAPIVPGKPDASVIIQRITHAQPARRMPPVSAHKTLTPKQVDTLKRWIAEGATWKEHWAFIAPVRPKTPAVKNQPWVRNPVDAFVLAKLEAAALTPAAAADRRTLIRRVTLDLTGLPPTAKEVDDFIADKSPNAYEKVVDRLLASPQWGEHRARYWLDAARYADTHGLHIDNFRAMWPYRDWVIQAFNRNMPFDQFTLEQIAGDLLPNPTTEQLIATGFHRCNVTTNEGGFIPEEVEAIYAKDRVDTTGTVFLGMTLGCASCHDHKFDPIAQKDFYAMAAFFRNTTQSPLDGNISDTPPTILIPRAEDKGRWQQLLDEQSALRTRLAKVRQESAPEFEKALKDPERRRISGPVDRADELLAIYAGKLVYKNKPVETALPEGITINDGALDFKGKASIELPNADVFSADQPFSVTARIRVPKGEEAYVIAGQSDPDSKSRGWALELNARRPTLRITLPNRTYQIRTNIDDRLAMGEWYDIAFTYDGSRHPAGIKLYVNGKEPLVDGRSDQPNLKGDFRNYAPLRIGSDGRRRSFDGGAISDLRLMTRALTADEIGLIRLWPVIDRAQGKALSEMTAEERAATLEYFLVREYGDYTSLLAEMSTLDEEREAIARRGTVTHVQYERTDRAPSAHILYRGMYDQPREKVEPAAPGALPPIPSALPKNRLGLAKWLVDETNPMTARVTVNRFWQEIFGTGLVKTAEDFGSQGETPSHPELLDWLAVEFRESGWDVKKFFRTLVTSATYRQSAATTPLKLEKDPNNTLLSRGPRFRMDAEMIRDAALASSGLLVPEIGGPSVKPYQPDGVWETVAMLGSNTRFYRRDTGANLYRRSLYTFWKRSAPPASMDLFNAPTRENCTVRRERTNTPLQALVTMNDTQFVEAARHLAETALKDGETWDQRLDGMTARVLARKLDLKERAVAERSYKDFLKHYDSHPEDAKKLIRVGEYESSTGADPTVLAALTMVANQILNLDEALNK